MCASCFLIDFRPEMALSSHPSPRFCDETRTGEASHRLAEESAANGAFETQKPNVFQEASSNAFLFTLLHTVMLTRVWFIDNLNVHASPLPIEI